MKNKYKAKFAECPFLSTHGNKCSRKGVGKYCSHLNNINNCPYYNEYVEERMMYEMNNPTKNKKRLILAPINPPKNVIQQSRCDDE